MELFNPVVSGMMGGMALASEIRRAAREREMLDRNQRMDERARAIQDIEVRRELNASARPVGPSGLVDVDATVESSPSAGIDIPGLGRIAAPAITGRLARPADPGRSVRWEGANYELMSPDEIAQRELEQRLGAARAQGQMNFIHQQMAAAEAEKRERDQFLWKRDQSMVPLPDEAAKRAGYAPGTRLPESMASTVTRPYVESQNKPDPAPRLFQTVNDRGDLVITSVNPTTNEVIGTRTVPGAGKRTRLGGGGAGSSGASSDPLVDAVIANPALYGDLTPSVKSRIAPALNARGFGAFGRAMNESAVGRLAESRSAISSLQDLRKTLQENEQYIGPIAGLQRLNPWSDARQAQARIDLVKQRVGKALEGGVLRKEDEEKYKKILATLSDTPELAIAKVDGLIATLQRDMDIFAEEQRAAGRRVPTPSNRSGSDSGIIRWGRDQNGNPAPLK